MSLQEHKHDIEGYTRTLEEIEVLRKYGFDYTTRKGEVQRIINQLHPKLVNLRVSEVREETGSSRTLRLVAEDGYLPPFQAGQYINLFVELAGVRTSRPYSISSPPNQTGFYDITVKRVDDGFVSNYLLDDVKAGDLFSSTSPSGNFFYNPLFHGQDLVFLGGGSGITPFMSMIREVTDRGLKRNIHLIYGCRDEADIIFGEELKDRAARHSNVKVSIAISEPKEGYTGPSGFITADLMKDLLGDVGSKMFYLCGPAAMYDFCLDELKKMNVPKRKIRTEVFGPPKDIAAQPGWPADVSPDEVYKVDVHGGKSINVKAGEPLLISLEKEGIIVPSSCRSGECSLCRLRLISGKVFQPPSAKLRYSDRLFGYIHSCAAYPLEDLEIAL